MTHEAKIAQAARDYIAAVRAIERGGTVELAETATTYQALAAAVDAEKVGAPVTTLGADERALWDTATAAVG